MTKSVSRRGGSRRTPSRQRRRSEIPSDEFEYENPRKMPSPRGSPNRHDNYRPTPGGQRESSMDQKGMTSHFGIRGERTKGDYTSSYDRRIDEPMHVSPGGPR